MSNEQPKSGMSVSQEHINDLYTLLHLSHHAVSGGAVLAALAEIGAIVTSEELAGQALIIVDPRSSAKAPMAYAVTFGAIGIEAIRYAPVYQAQMSFVDAIREDPDMTPEQRTYWEGLAQERTPDNG